MKEKIFSLSEEVKKKNLLIDLHVEVGNLPQCGSGGQRMSRRHFSPSILWEPAMELCSPGLKATAVTCRLSSSEMRAFVSGCFGLNKLG